MSRSRMVIIVPAADNSVSFADLVSVVRRRWRVYLSVVLVAALIGLALTFVLPRRYEAELVALPRGSDRSALLSSLGQLGGLAAIAGLAGGESGQRAEAVQMLQSQILARDFIRENNLRPVLYPTDWDESRQAWKGREKTLNDAVELFDHRVRNVIEDRRTGLVTLRITWREPVQAAAWANELVRRANDELRRRAVARAQGAIDYLKREARAAETVEVQQSLYRLMEDQYKTLLLANVSADYAFSVIDPAVAADPKHYVFPRRGLFTFGGFFFGLVLALVFAFLEAAQRPPAQVSQGPSP
jgi:uncharacterized protein involved in exopolysaccharide biosynthesis